MRNITITATCPKCNGVKSYNSKLHGSIPFCKICLVPMEVKKIINKSDKSIKA